MRAGTGESKERTMVDTGLLVTCLLAFHDSFIALARSTFAVSLAEKFGNTFIAVRTCSVSSNIVGHPDNTRYLDM